MRGRGGRSSSSSSSASLSGSQQQRGGMALRRQPIRNVSSDSQCLDEDEAAADREDGEEFSSLLLTTRREKRWREREDKSKPKDMTEEEMMDLALRLSEQEASVSALRRQQEEEAVMKAIQESMVEQTQPGGTPQADSPLRLGSRRKLLYPNGTKPLAGGDKEEDGCVSETRLNSAADGAGDGYPNWSKKRKRKARSPLQEMPDWTQTQVSPSRSGSSSLCLDSPQSSDSTQIEDSQLQMSPVFPLTGCRALVQVDRLDQDLVETCRNSGFVLCSEDSWTSPEKSTQPKSPTFPQSGPSRPKSPVFIDMDQDGGGDLDLNPQLAHSPVNSPCASRLHASQVHFSSLETLSPSVMSGSCRPSSPVFPKSPAPSNKPPLSDQVAVPGSPDRGQTEPGQEPSTSPPLGLTSQRRTDTDVLMSAGPSDHRKNTRSDGLKTAMALPESEELRDKPTDWSCAETELTSDMTLVWSDEDDVVPVGSPSPVFPGEQHLHRAEIQSASQSQPAAEPAACSGDPSSSDKLAPPGSSSSSASTRRQGQRDPTREAVDMVPPPPEGLSGGQAVHYYWGVPFCPRGLDPDTYTQVIMAQMEIYEKSLKQAQRCLLRKAEWGEAVLPQPEKCPSPEVPAGSPQHHAPQRRGLRLRGRKAKEAADSQPAEAEEGEDRDDEEELQQEQEKEKDEGDEQQMKTDDCEVCPETQLSDNEDLLMDVQTEAEPPCKSPELPEIEMILQEDSPAGEEPQEQELQEEEEEEVDERMEIKVGRVDPGGLSEEETGPDLQEVQDEAPLKSTSPEPEPAVVPHSPKASMDCPICQTSFPVGEIEMHAAYCDGEVAVVAERRPQSNRFQESVKPRRKRWRRAEGAEEPDRPSIAGRNQEKCYICQKSVPLGDYKRHTELCIQRRATRPAARGTLLSALERTESRKSDAGASGSKVPPEEVIDLRDDDDDDEEEEETAAFRISNSPIRSFTPISEATDCLINFKKHQQAKKPSQRRR